MLICQAQPYNILNFVRELKSISVGLIIFIPTNVQPKSRHCGGHFQNYVLYDSCTAAATCGHDAWSPSGRFRNQPVIGALQQPLLKLCIPTMAPILDSYCLCCHLWSCRLEPQRPFLELARDIGPNSLQLPPPAVILRGKKLPPPSQEVQYCKL